MLFTRTKVQQANKQDTVTASSTTSRDKKQAHYITIGPGEDRWDYLWFDLHLWFSHGTSVYQNLETLVSVKVFLKYR